MAHNFSAGIRDGRVVLFIGKDRARRRHTEYTTREAAEHAARNPGDEWAYAIIVEPHVLEECEHGYLLTQRAYCRGCSDVPDSALHLRAKRTGAR